MKRILVVIIVIVILAGGGYYIADSFLIEYMAYKKDTNSCDLPGDYAKRYPGGKWIEDYKDFHMKCQIKYLIKFPTLTKIYYFNKDYPGHPYQEKVQSIRDSIWEASLAKYDLALENGTGNPQASEFFRQMLNYLEENDKDLVYVRLRGSTDLKDLEDYPAATQEALNSIYSSPRLDTKLLKLTSYFKEGDLYRLNAILEQGVRRSLVLSFSNGFLSVITVGSKYGKKLEEDDVVIEVNYKIKNQERTNGDPKVWEYSFNDVFIAYLLGIDIVYDLSIKIPGTDQVYELQTIENAGEGFSFEGGPTDIYPEMTRQVFIRYSNDLTNGFGLRDGHD